MKNCGGSRSLAIICSVAEAGHRLPYNLAFGCGAVGDGFPINRFSDLRPETLRLRREQAPALQGTPYPAAKISLRCASAKRCPSPSSPTPAPLFPSLNLVPVFAWLVKFLTSHHLFPNFEGQLWGCVGRRGVGASTTLPLAVVL